MRWLVWTARRFIWLTWIPLECLGSILDSLVRVLERLWDLNGWFILFRWVSERRPALWGPIPSSISTISSMSTSNAESNSTESSGLHSSKSLLSAAISFLFSCFRSYSSFSVLELLGYSCAFYSNLSVLFVMSRLFWLQFTLWESTEVVINGSRPFQNNNLFHCLHYIIWNYLFF